jgi:hypothetical protein
MSGLYNNGKLHFKKLNPEVNEQDLIYWQQLSLECLNENPDITTLLDKYYKAIYFYVFYSSTDPNVGDVIKQALSDSTVDYSAHPVIASTYSSNNIGCIVVFVKHYKDTISAGQYRQYVTAYTKNGIFEEFCHLVQQKGNMNNLPISFIEMWQLYVLSNKPEHVSTIMHELYGTREHYAVFSMMMHAYPDDWVRRYSNYYNATFEEYKQIYDIRKKSFPQKILHGYLISDYLKMLIMLWISKKVEIKRLHESNRKILDDIIANGMADIESKKLLIRTEIGEKALNLIDSLDESVFESSTVFFTDILHIWQNLLLI